jgi:predicted small integral membrane protein
MLDQIILFVLAVNVGFLAAWLTVGALENLFHPFLNETYTAEVMDMARMREDYPEAYAFVSYRRIVSAPLRRILFRLIVAWELISALALWIGAGALLLASFAIGAVEPALSLALIGTLLFTTTWCGFLVVGNWFCYWFGHEGGQNTHFQMTLWGMGTMILIVASANLLL